MSVEEASLPALSSGAANRLVFGEVDGGLLVLAVALGLANRWLARDWSRWPLTSAEGCLRTWADVRAGQVDSKLASLALYHVESDGENMVVW